MDLVLTSLSGIYVLNRSPKGDSRGYLERLFCQETLSEVLVERTIRQINHTSTATKGIVRGLHFQFPPHAEMKVISCLKGEVFDVTVDLRKGSPTFLEHYSTILSAKNFSSLIISEGFAHGFQTLTDDCEMLYFHTADYQPASEGVLNALDPRLGIQWPLSITDRSKRDEQHALLTDSFVGIEVA